MFIYICISSQVKQEYIILLSAEIMHYLKQLLSIKKYKNLNDLICKKITIIKKNEQLILVGTTKINPVNIIYRVMMKMFIFE